MLSCTHRFCDHLCMVWWWWHHPTVSHSCHVNWLPSLIGAVDCVLQSDTITSNSLVIKHEYEYLAKSNVSVGKHHSIPLTTYILSMVCMSLTAKLLEICLFYSCLQNQTRKKCKQNTITWNYYPHIMQFNINPVSTFADTLKTIWVPNMSSLYFNNAQKFKYNN